MRISSPTTNCKPPMIIAGMTRVGKRWHYEHSKACARCHTIKDVTEFYAMPSKGGRLHSYCKQCNWEVRMLWEAARRREACTRAYEHAVRTIRSGSTIDITLLPPPVRRTIVDQLTAMGRPPKVIARLLRCNVKTVYVYHSSERQISDGSSDRLSYA